VIDNSRPYISKLNSEVIKNIKSEINKINETDDYVTFGIVVNKCDLSGMNKHKILLELKTKCDFSDNIFFVSARQMLLDSIMIYGVDLKISCEFSTEELRSLFKTAGYSFTKNIVNGFNNKLIKITTVKKSKNEDEDDIEIKYDNIFESITDIIKCSINKKSDNLKRIIEQKIIAFVTTINDGETLVSSEDDNINDLQNLETSIINIVKQYYELHSDNLKEITSLLNNMINIFKKYSKDLYDITIFVNIMDKLNNTKLFNLLTNFIEHNINNIQIDSMINAFVYLLTHNIYDDYNNIDKNMIIINKILKCKNIYVNNMVGKLYNAPLLPNKIKILLKIATTEPTILKLLLLNNAICENHFTLFEYPSDAYLKFKYNIYSYTYSSTLNEQLFTLIETTSSDYINFKQEYEYYKNI
jgi:hypothetical protein